MSVSDIIRRAIAFAEPHGEITFDELNRQCGSEIRPEDIEAILSALSDAGIDLVEERH